ncbi:MAG TPA: HAMP domain-containing sensor histidine kinase [Chitinophagales bacterium]|nr:HAMP domain-containing sensor histidine kinase [Chitinophagales bacterium]
MTFEKSKDLYSQRQFLRWLMLGCVSIIIFFSLAFTLYLAKSIEKDERSRVHEVAMAYRTLISSTDENEIDDALKITRKNETIPVIWVSYQNELYDSKNLDNSKILNDKQAFDKYLKKLKRKNQVVEFVVNTDEPHQLLYYDSSEVLKLLKVYPYLLLGLVALFLTIALIAVSFSRTASQNQLWVGMAKETAHQLGTPLSSLSAWIDYLEAKFENTDDSFIVDELKKDVDRLDLVADRFSKIGSKPTFASTNVNHLAQNTVSYMSSRAPKSVDFSVIDLTSENSYASINSSLFEWVLENLIKNALDAIEGVGKIQLTIQIVKQNIVIDIKDSGKGIPKNKINSIFEPGFSTKKRGWGLGLTLTKRIIEQYHNGKIYVKESSEDKGTTFRISVRKAGKED